MKRREFRKLVVAEFGRGIVIWQDEQSGEWRCLWDGDDYALRAGRFAKLG